MYTPAKVVSTERLSSSMYMKKVKLLDGDTVEPKPFQFILIWVPGVDLLPMSVAGFTSGEITLVVRERGEGTRKLLHYDGFLGVSGFHGKGFEPWGYRRILFVAGGSGIAPFFHLAEKAWEKDIVVDVVWGVREAGELFNPARLLGKPRGDVYVATEDCRVGYCGRASHLASRLVAGNPGKWDAVIASGPIGLLREACGSLGGFLDVYVNLEAYVKCGVGACGSCVLKPHGLLLCRHGPVFKCSEVEEFLKGGTGA
ncbi:dihydroorotate dehydrogenase [Desulfurococcus mucosus]|uniref:Dihydroorotate dehydrogenase, electron transfer subunit, iron-sulfur cluster binding domain protein n=1 Tax=Desulfurococcus mucosus (strain ATCC 35584 / DSM 2162 / JCM 9187 / O7/1) TaxID=765177 RepID=E8R8P6_DESM0|nr:dihydroorotate dehydrogenase [Desulfurococcus mucosus]ADV64872.1 Dihydroorotate dehydrogenase, electron transfer subunit, iron-sulfur cluster binding domain protein [Desulfurococcus mucosus DSM 2162]